MQQAKRGARGFRTAANFIAVAYLRLGKLTYLMRVNFAPRVWDDHAFIVSQFQPAVT